MNFKHGGWISSFFFLGHSWNFTIYFPEAISWHKTYKWWIRFQLASLLNWTPHTLENPFLAGNNNIHHIFYDSSIKEKD